MTRAHADAELADASFRLMTREPFYGHVFSGMLRELTPDVPTITVEPAPGHMIRLRVNPDWWRAEPAPDRQIGRLKHQILHLVLGHVLTERRYLHRALFGVAADLVVNQYIEDAGLEPDAITLRSFPALALPLGEDVGTYYDRLLAALARPAAGPTAPGPAGPAADPTTPGPTTPDDPAAPLAALLRAGHPALDQHDGWRRFDDQTAAERRVARQYITDAIRRSVRRIPPTERGRLPHALRRAIDAALTDTPAVDWRRVLRLFAGTSRRTYLRDTLRRPSARYGTTPGLTVRRRHRVIVAIDTSGSMSEATLRLVFAELHHLHRNGAEITVVECDAAIHATWPYRGHLPPTAHGGGGTDFDPVITWANSQPHRPDALIYLTDGGAPRPRVTPRMPTLWIITPPGRGDHLPGRVLHLPSDTEPSP